MNLKQKLDALYALKRAVERNHGVTISAKPNRRGYWCDVQALDGSVTQLEGVTVFAALLELEALK